MLFSPPSLFASHTSKRGRKRRRRKRRRKRRRRKKEKVKGKKSEEKKKDMWKVKNTDKRVYFLQFLAILMPFDTPSFNYSKGTFMDQNLSQESGFS